MSHLCFLTPLHWAGWLPWLPSPDIPVGPLRVLGQRRLLERGVSLPSSSSQEWLATDRKPLTESSDSDSVGWQGADTRSYQTPTLTRSCSETCSSVASTGCRRWKRTTPRIHHSHHCPSLLPGSPTWGLYSNERPHRGFISSNTVCSELSGYYSSP